MPGAILCHGSRSWLIKNTANDTFTYYSMAERHSSTPTTILVHKVTSNFFTYCTAKTTNPQKTHCEVPNMRRVNLTKFNMGAQLLRNLDSLRQVLNEWHIFLQVTGDHKACRQAATSGTVKWSQASNCSYANGYLKLAPKLNQSPQTAMLKCPTKAYLKPGAKNVLFLYG